MSDIINSLPGSRILLRLMLFAAFASFVAWPLPGLTQQPQRVVEAFGPFKIIGNIYYVGDKGNAVYLFTTPEGHILFDTGYPETAPIVRESVEKLGFRMRDIKIMINGHAHVDHVGGHALVKEMTGALIVASELDAPVIESGARRGDFRGPRANPWAPAKVDRIIQDGDTVSLGGVTLTAHHTPGHTLGNLSWTTTIEDGGRRLNVAIMPSIGVNQGVRVVNNPQQPDHHRSIPEHVPDSQNAALRCLPEPSRKPLRPRSEIRAHAGRRGAESVHRSRRVPPVRGGRRSPLHETSRRGEPGRTIGGASPTIRSPHSEISPLALLQFGRDGCGTAHGQ